MRMRKVYKVMKTGGENLGGPALSWWIVLGPGVGRTHYVTKKQAQDVADMMNLAVAAAQKPKERPVRIKVFNTPPYHAAFGWYTVGSVRRTKGAQIDVNVGAIMRSIGVDAIPRKDVPYLVAKVIMHEVVHALEDWARVEFNHHKIAALLRVLNTQPGRAHGKARR